MRCVSLFPKTQLIRANRALICKFSSGISGATRKAKNVENSTKMTYAEASSRILNDIDDAIDHMKKLNNPFSVTKTNEELVVNSGKLGVFSFKLHPNEQTLVYNSPVSGVVTYFFDSKVEHWLSTMDGHDMRGLVTRDFVRHHVGCPMFKL